VSLEVKQHHNDGADLPSSWNSDH